MKDYTFITKEDKNTYILKFDIVDDKILVHYASGAVDYIDITEENYKIIVDKINKQVMNLIEHVKEHNYSAKDMIIFWNCIIALLSSFIDKEICDDYFLIIIGFYLFGNVCLFSSKNYKAIKEFKKLKLYYENMKLLNNMSVEYNNSVLLSESFNDEIRRRYDTSLLYRFYDLFDPGFIDEIKYKDLEQLIDNLNREKTFNYQRKLTSNDDTR